MLPVASIFFSSKVKITNLSKWLPLPCKKKIPSLNPFNNVLMTLKTEYLSLPQHFSWFHDCCICKKKKYQEGIKIMGTCPKQRNMIEKKKQTHMPEPCCWKRLHLAIGIYCESNMSLTLQNHETGRPVMEHCKKNETIIAAIRRKKAFFSFMHTSLSNIIGPFWLAHINALILDLLQDGSVFLFTKSTNLCG